jgi:DNA-binding GntR family transcriptional regulator
MVTMPPTTSQGVATRTLVRSSLRDSARDALREMIINGEIAGGVPLRQDELAAQLGISRTPLREALQALVGEGLVRIDPRKGAVVTKPSPQQLLETYEIREVLERMAGRAAALGSTPAHVAAVERIHVELEATDDPDRWAELNARFHAAIYEMTGRPQLVELIDMLRNRSKLYVRILASAQAPARHAADEHAEMLEALRRRDPDAMDDVISRHLRFTADFVTSVLQAGADRAGKALWD